MDLLGVVWLFYFFSLKQLTLPYTNYRVVICTSTGPVMHTSDTDRRSVVFLSLRPNRCEWIHSIAYLFDVHQQLFQQKYRTRKRNEAKRIDCTASSYQAITSIHPPRTLGYYYTTTTRFVPSKSHLYLLFLYLFPFFSWTFWHTHTRTWRYQPPPPHHDPSPLRPRRLPYHDRSMRTNVRVPVPLTVNPVVTTRKVIITGAVIGIKIRIRPKLLIAVAIMCMNLCVTMPIRWCMNWLPRPHFKKWTKNYNWGIKKWVEIEQETARIMEGLL